jgi:hypothetical protein
MMRIVGLLTLVLLLAAPGHTLEAQQVRVIAPGMTEGQVRESWGEPLVVRQRGEFTYMFYENGCLKTCGMHDLVILQGGQVIDAVARASYHAYDGVSSSPRERVPEPTLPVTGQSSSTDA